MFSGLDIKIVTFIYMLSLVTYSNLMRAAIRSGLAVKQKKNTIGFLFLAVLQKKLF